MPEKTDRFDVADYLDTPEMQAAYLSNAFETDDPAYIAQAIGAVVRARNVAEIARAADLARPTLYQAFSNCGNPRLATLIAVMKSLGFTISVKTAAPD